MQHCLHDIVGYAIRASDGDLGKVHDFYFDDTTWSIRYLVAETKNWLSSRKVLISLVVLDKPDWASSTLKVDLSCLQIRNSPDINTQLPVYRQHETVLHEYYKWAPYWNIGYGGTFGITPFQLFENPLLVRSPEPERQEDLHLRSTHHLTGYRIHALDGEIGTVEDFIVDDETWSLNFLIIDTGNWLLERKILISTKWITDVNWKDKTVHIKHSREFLDNSPGYDPMQPFISPNAFEQLSLDHSRES